MSDEKERAEAQEFAETLSKMIDDSIKSVTPQLKPKILVVGADGVSASINGRPITLMTHPNQGLRSGDTVVAVPLNYTSYYVIGKTK